MQVAKDFPDFEVEKVGFLTDRAGACEAGVKTIPALVSGQKKLTGMLLTKRKIRGFLESL